MTKIWIWKCLNINITATAKSCEQLQMLFDTPVGPLRQFLDLWDSLSIRDVFQQHTVFKVFHLPVSLHRVCCWRKKGCIRKRLSSSNTWLSEYPAWPGKKSINVLCWATSKYPRMQIYFVTRKKKEKKKKVGKGWGREDRIFIYLFLNGVQATAFYLCPLTVLQVLSLQPFKNDLTLRRG